LLKPGRLFYCSAANPYRVQPKSFEQGEKEFMMKKTLPGKIFVFALLACSFLPGEARARQTQNTEPAATRRNSPYSPNPKRKTEPVAAPKTTPVEIKAGTDSSKNGARGTPNENAATRQAPPPSAGTENNAQPNEQDAENAEFQNAYF
jgi:hypothetical protein